MGSPQLTLLGGFQARLGAGPAIALLTKEGPGAAGLPRRAGRAGAPTRQAGDAALGEAVRVAEGVTEPLLTCEAVLAEASFHLKSVALVLAILRKGLTVVAFDCRDHLPQFEALALRYADRRPDLADLCLIRMSELHPRHSVVTVDQEDFRVYRRNKREVIPLVCPPGA